VVEHRGGHRAEQQDLGRLEDRLVGVAVDAAVGCDPGAADAVDGLDPPDQLARQRRAEDRRG
jgi:hypothetical protein